MSISPIATDAFNAMSTIPGVSGLLIESEDETEARLSFDYNADARFWQTEEYLVPFWLKRA